MAIFRKSIMKKQNPTIQGLRGLLALLVVIFHTYRGLVAEELLDPLLRATWVESLGKVSVNLFFVISGFLIIQSLVKHESLSKFFVNRVLRIYPVFLVIHLLVFAAGPMIGYKWMLDLSVTRYVFYFVSNLLLLPGIFTDFPTAQIVAWSVSYEFLFYILIGTMFVAIRNRDSKWNKLLMIVVSITSLAFLYFHPRALFFVVGILLYKTIGTINEKIKYSPIFSFNGLILLSLLILFYGDISLFVSLCLSFLLFISMINEEGTLASLLRTKVFNYLGRISYSLYLWHTFVMFPIKIVLHKIAVYNHSPILLFTINLILSVTISILVSHFSFKFIEQKFTNFVKGKIYVKKSVQARKVNVSVN